MSADPCARAPIYRFGGFELHPDPPELRRDGQPLKMGRRALAVLRVLIERRDRAVTKQELFDLVWSERIVEDDNLKVQVLGLRRVLGREAIATVAGQGYRFVLAVDSVEQGSRWPATLPTPAALDAPPGWQGPPPRSLIGRSRELDELAAWLRRHPLISVTGAGGIGKTSLAIAAAARVAPLFGAGVWWVDLAALDDKADITEAVARAMGFASGGTPRSCQSLAAALAGTDALLVLDNAERVRTGVAALASALRLTGRPPTLLVTTQAALDLSGEQLYRLDALSVPPPAVGPTQALGYGAVALFVERVRQQQPGFQLDEATLPGVLAICSALHGHSLAIELAAARVRTLGLSGVQARLGNRLALLRGGPGDAPARQRTLLDTLRWSHALLEPTQRLLLRRLAVCRGSFGLETAQALGQPELDEWEVIDALSVLLDRAWLQLDPGDPPRYRMLDSPACLAAEALHEAGEAHRAQQALARSMRVTLEHADADALSTPALAWTARLHPDDEHLRACVEWCAAPGGDALLGAGLLAWAGSHWVLSGQGAWAARRIQALDPARVGALDPATRARLQLTTAALAANLFVTSDEGQHAARQAIEAFAGLGDGPRQYLAHYHAFSIGERLENGQDMADNLLAMQRLEHPAWPATLRYLGQWARARHAHRGASPEVHHRAALTLLEQARANGDDRSAWLAAHTIALADLGLGDPASGAARMHQVVGEIRQRGLQRRFVFQFALAALLQILSGESSRARAALAEAGAMLRAEGAIWWFDCALGLFAADAGDRRGAALLLGWADASTLARGDQRGPLQSQVADQLRRRMQALHAPELLQQLLAEGAALDDEHALALALAPPPA